MDRLASMATFVRAADLGSFAAAASALAMSPQMVAKHVAYLEARLGARLLNRTTRRQSPTEVGKVYYERCKLVLAEADWADAAGSDATGTPRGRLRINAPVSFGTHTLMPLVSTSRRAAGCESTMPMHFWPRRWTVSASPSSPRISRDPSCRRGGWCGYCRTSTRCRDRCTCCSKLIAGRPRSCAVSST